ncbi:EF-hand domain-containing protein [Planctobacterium marinum]|uniref:EF-hand domain-containing protein n=1 Tax=Planctobacterium marinum TaxID=1631968 RepID=UPI001E5F2840|nr:EF-hand domain-containing protein [Planctobacterium marinum]MCC2604123.1 EF-hand domain-containing protein [Planctobacterium marinum]
MSDTKEIDQEKINQIREEFDFFDNDKNGEIDFGEFFELLKVISPKAKESQAQEGFALIDENGDGSIDFDEFLAWWQDNWWEY